MSRISVIVPVYKVEKYLNRCVDSILEQTFTDFELILVDDGSPDNCVKICDDYAKKDSRIRVIHKQNGGLSDARNVGIDWVFKNSGSKWITFIDSDDWISPNYLEVLYNIVTKQNKDISICNFVKTDGLNENIFSDRVSVKFWNTEELFCENNAVATVAWGKLYKRDLFSKIRYPVGMLHEDAFVTYKLLFKYYEVAVVEEPLYAYFQRDSSIMNMSWSPRRLVAFDAYDEQIKFFKKNNFIKAYNRTIYAYTFVLIEQMEKCKNSPNYSDYYVKMRKMLKRHLFKYHRSETISLKTVPWLYSREFPLFMRIYSKMHRIRNK